MSGELTTSLPKGGAPGQVLTKVSYDNYKVDWKDPAGGGGGGDGEIYSTEETRIGTWIDGKPLYRIVLTGTFTNSNNGRIFTFTDEIYPVRVSAFIHYGTGQKNATPLPYSYENGEYGIIFVENGVYVIISLSEPILIGSPFHAILEYIKLSD